MFYDAENIQDVIDHIKKIPISVMIVDYTRCGSDFFQSLLDNHPQILQFTGYYIFHDFWDNANHNNLKILIDEFVDFENHFMKFDSKLNIVERWDKLGENKNESFTVDINLFKKIAFDIQSKLDLNSRNFFLSINAAYFIARGFDIFKTKVLFYHLHRADRIERFQKDFKNFKLIIMTRDLRDGIVSYFESRIYHKYDPYTFIPPILTYSNIFWDVQKFDNIVFNVLKSLHHDSEAVLKNVCKYFQIEYLPDILTKSTWHGKLWWGDKWSNRDLNGFNTNFGNTTRWRGKLTFLDIYLLEFLFKKQFTKFNYKFYYKQFFFPINIFIIILLIFLPMKYEFKIFLHNFINEKSLKIKISKSFSLLKVYGLRVKYYLLNYIRICFKKNMKLPTFLNEDFFI